MRRIFCSSDSQNKSVQEDHWGINWNFRFSVSTKDTDPYGLAFLKSTPGISDAGGLQTLLWCCYQKKKKKILGEHTCTQFNMYLLSTCYGICTRHYEGYKETEDLMPLLKELPGKQLHRPISRCCNVRKIMRRTANGLVSSFTYKASNMVNP